MSNKIRRLTANDVNVYRTIRLTALQTDRDAFGSTFERESLFDETTWLERITTFKNKPNTVVIEEIEGQPIAVGGIGITEEYHVAEIWGMWVTPTARRQGSGRRILCELKKWAKENQITGIVLHVFKHNTEAINLYKRCGFDASSPNDSTNTNSSSEIEMNLTLK